MDGLGLGRLSGRGVKVSERPCERHPVPPIIEYVMQANVRNPNTALCCIVLCNLFEYTAEHS